MSVALKCRRIRSQGGCKSDVGQAKRSTGEGPRIDHQFADGGDVSERSSAIQSEGCKALAGRPAVEFEIAREIRGLGLRMPSSYRGPHQEDSRLEFVGRTKTNLCERGSFFYNPSIWASNGYFTEKGNIK